jgi:microtubule-associated protein-like 6
MYAPNGAICFFAAGLAVVMNQKMRTQRFYSEHNATITAMAVNKLDGVIATGDQGEAPTIRVWSCETLQTVAILEGFHRRAICHLKFSPDGKYLISVGQDANHSLALYDWRNKQVMSTAVSFEAKSLFIDFNPNGVGLIHCGNEIIRFWEFDGRNMTFQDATLGSRAKLQGYMCAGWIGSSAVVGTADGNLYRFLGNKLDSIVQAHAGAVNSIAYTSDGLCTAGCDGFIKVWTRFLECRLVVELKRLLTVNGVVRCIDW